MADARSMLRASREARKIKHPHASYTSEGKLLCNLCETAIKTESSWQGHLHSTQHTLRLSRAQDATAVRSGDGGSKKRKASVSESPIFEGRKRARPTAFAPGIEDDHEDADDERVEVVKAAHGNSQQTTASLANDEEVADPAELEAFERELQQLEASMLKDAAAKSNVTISAPAMTAEEIAAQAREEQSTQRERRDAELEGEKEDAARILEDEFEEMKGFEERVKKLRDMREALRKAPEPGGPVTTTTTEPAMPEAINADEESDEDFDEDDEDDGWNFGAR